MGRHNRPATCLPLRSAPMPPRARPLPPVAGRHIAARAGDDEGSRPGAMPCRCAAPRRLPRWRHRGTYLGRVPCRGSCRQRHQGMPRPSRRTARTAVSPSTGRG
ncbi:hypothetical protein GQ55_2G330200 [Panicum hallii var. hallii]|uniref:Uncharacterized protein n=1 Tax=Panicum hallii var. hallii TaxID=1504633 RepID=A0A2T7EUY4_9POAL|nr:hypothetical protein GQ55_2G330200 [Panicum hallii var. hallii]